MRNQLKARREIAILPRLPKRGNERLRIVSEGEVVPLPRSFGRASIRLAESVEPVQVHVRDEAEYLRKRDVIKTRDTDEETKWRQIIELVYKLPFDTLIDLRNLLWEELPTPEYVLDFLDKKSKKKRAHRVLFR